MTASPVRWPFAILSMPIRFTLAFVLFLLAGCANSPQQQTAHDTAPNSRPQHAFFSFGGRSNGSECLAEWHSAPPLQPDLWDRVQKNYVFKNYNNERVITERNWYANHQTYLDRMSGNASRYLYHVTAELERRQLPGELALLPIVESAYNPFAYSNSQASGLWQFIPSTAKHLSMDMNWWYDGRRDILASTDNALDYLVFLRDHYDGDWLKALAAYNAGWGTIDRAVAKNRAKGLPTDYWSLDVPAETKAYVPKLLALAQISKQPSAYGVYWAYIPDLPYFAAVNIDSQLDITRAADMAGVSSDELYLLNPGISRWATPPGSSYRLLVPVDQANELQERIAGLGTENRMQWAHYTVQKGDSVSKIAKRFNTSADLIQNVNNKRPMDIVAGTELRMPVPDHSLPQLATNPRVQEIEDKEAKKLQILSGRNYLVQSGDTLALVARKQNVSIADIKRLNNMGDKDPLILGQRLALPALAKPVASAVTAKTPTASKPTTLASKNTAAPVTEKNTTAKPVNNAVASNPATNSKVSEKTVADNKSKTAYKVQNGDTLMAIARKHKLSVDDVARWNALDKNRYTLQPGQMLTLYLDQRNKF